MEYLIDEAGEANVVFHDRLAELYLHATADPAHSEGKSSNSNVITPKYTQEIPHLVAEREDAYTKLLHFIRTSEYYSPDRLIGRLPPTCTFLDLNAREDAITSDFVISVRVYSPFRGSCHRLRQTWQARSCPRNIRPSSTRL